MKWDEPAITRHEIVSMAQVCCAKTNVEEREWRLISLNLFAWVPWRWGCCRWRWWFWRAPLKWINELTDESCFRWQRHKTFYSLLSPDKLKAKSCSIYLDLPLGLMCAHAYPHYCELPMHGVCHSLVPWESFEIIVARREMNEASRWQVTQELIDCIVKSYEARIRERRNIAFFDCWQRLRPNNYVFHWKSVAGKKLPPACPTTICPMRASIRQMWGACANVGGVRATLASQMNGKRYF